MTTRSRELTTCLATAGLLLAGLMGCSAADPPEADPTPTSSSSPGSSSTPEPSSEPSAEPTETVAPATGDPIVFEQFTLNAPQGWTVTKGLVFSIDVESPPPRVQVRRGEPFGFMSVSSGPAVERTLAQSATRQLGDGLERAEDIELGGEAAYHVSKQDQSFETAEIFGLWRDGENVRIRFSLIEATPAKRQKLIESVLATWEWTT